MLKDRLSRILVFSGAALLLQPVFAPVYAQQPQVPGTAITTTEPAAPLSKKELKAQRRQQKNQQKAADQEAKAQKDQADALKHQNKATDAAQKANAPQ